MIRLTLLGCTDLRSPEGDELRSVLSQPKRLALLTFLSLNLPQGFTRRDKLLGLFWPELTQERGRAALRQSLHFLRRSLAPTPVLETRGDEEVRVKPGTLWCDAVSMREAMGQEDWNSALDLFRGDLLEGFFLADCPEFEDWLENERHAFRKSAGNAGWVRAHDLLETGHISDAEAMGERALALEITNEARVGDFIESLAAGGHPAASLRFYDKFRQVLKEKLLVQPTAEMQARVDAIRASSVVALSPDRGDSAHVPSERYPAKGRPKANPTLLRQRATWGAMGVLAATLAIFGWLYLPWGGEAAPSLDPNRLIVVPFENRTGDPSLDELGIQAAEWIGLAVQQVGGVLIVPAIWARQYWEDATMAGSQDVLGAVAERTTAGWAVVGTMFKVGDSIRFGVEIVNVIQGSREQAFDEVWPLDDPQGAVSRLAQRVGGALELEFYPILEEMEGGAGPVPFPPTMEASRAHRLGWLAFTRGAEEEAFAHYVEAHALDSTLVRPLTQAAFCTDDYALRDSLARFADVRRHLLSEMGQLDLDILLAVLDRDRDAALAAARVQAKLEGGGYASIVQSFFARRQNRSQEAVEALAPYDPYLEWRQDEADAYWRSLTRALHMAGEHGRELAEARRGRTEYPNHLASLINEIRALAGLGRVDELMAVLGQAPLIDQRPARAAVWAGLELREHGSPQSAVAAFERALDWLEARPTAEKSGEEHRQWLADALYGMERWAEARTVYEGLVTDSQSGIAALGRVGMCAARLGDDVTARAVELQLSEMQVPRSIDRHHYVRACLAAVMDKPDEAMVLLNEAVHENLPFEPRVFRDMDLESLRGRADFQEWLRPKG